jgi:hypothetical protein
MDPCCALAASSAVARQRVRHLGEIDLRKRNTEVPHRRNCPFCRRRVVRRNGGHLENAALELGRTLIAVA